jgi:hypothetical protein
MWSAPRLYREASERRSLFIRDKPVLSSEKMLQKYSYRKGSVAKKSLAVILKGHDAKMN